MIKKILTPLITLLSALIILFIVYFSCKYFFFAINRGIIKWSWSFLFIPMMGGFCCLIAGLFKEFVG